MRGGIALCLASLSLLMLVGVHLSNGSRTPAGAPELSVVTYEVTGGWGYAVRLDGRAVVVQPHVPAVSGTAPFRQRDHAEAVGRLVASRIAAGDSPTVSSLDLDSLGLLTTPVLTGSLPCAPCGLSTP